MDQLKLTACSNFHGSIELPGSKSITNRILLLASLGQGNVLIKNSLQSDDTNHMIKALEELGVKIKNQTEGMEI